ncbi:VOC family protein [uncultured Lentibacter sp.]|jgi:predicted enzyme related to lactoylglutathione lyase|uniref:VOC family protein n=1 Tax=uncultured Lentibacter sp. TaxID=1659309 RepID=UPI0026047E40|nr:VOC family protein [uncultured Lentibacter sp.]
MDYETVAPDQFGASLRGFGFNILVQDVPRSARFLSEVFDLAAHRVSADFAIIRQGQAVLQLHADSTYGQHPLLGLLPDNPPRGAGVEIRLYECDPDTAAARAKAAGGALLQAPSDRPHGLREAYILCPDGYAWVPSRPV